MSPTQSLCRYGLELVVTGRVGVIPGDVGGADVIGGGTGVRTTAGGLTWSHNRSKPMKATMSRPVEPGRRIRHGRLSSMSATAPGYPGRDRDNLKVGPGTFDT